MPTIRCPQCGTEIEEGTTEFCPNPNCGFPLSFGKEPETEETTPAMERKPLEQAATKPVVQQTAPVTPPPVTPPPVVTPPAQPPPPKKGPNLALLIGGVAAAVIAIVVLVIVLGGGDDEKDKKAAPKDGEQTTAPLNFVRASGGEEVFGGDSDQIINRVVAADDQLIAVGRDGPEGSYDAAVWTSTDGESWSRVTPDEAVFGGDGEQEMLGIAQGDDGRYVIVGRDNPTGGDDFNDDAAVWVSDGVVFDRVDPTQAAFGGAGKQVMTRVISGGPGFIAVGTDDTTGSDVPDAGLWKSVDGTRWARDNAQSSLTGPDDEFMRSIVPFEDGFVGAGRVNRDGDFDAAIWRSTSGTLFDRILGTEETFGGEGHQEMFTVTAGGPGLVAVGAAGPKERDEDASVWVSQDGGSWERIDDPVFGGDGIQLMLGVMSTPDLVVAVGFDGSQAPHDGVAGFDGAVWQSSDGRAWVRVPGDLFGGPEEQQIKNAVAYQGKIVAVGWDGSGGDLDAAVWTAPLDD